MIGAGRATLRAAWWLVHLSGRRHPAHGAVDQPCRRRPQRRAQPKAARPMSDDCPRHRGPDRRPALVAPTGRGGRRRLDSTLRARGDPVRRRRIGFRQVGDGHAPSSACCREPHVRVTCGRILFEGKDLLARLPPDENPRVRGGRIAMIFQEPMTALNPLQTHRPADSTKSIAGAHRACARPSGAERVLDVLGRRAPAGPAAHLRVATRTSFPAASASGR